MLPRTIQIACLGFFMAVAAEGRASLADNFSGINIYSLMPLLFIASVSGKPVSNITTVDLTNKTITNFDLQSNKTKIINLNRGDKTIVSSENKTTVLLEDKDILSLRKSVAGLQRQILSQKMEIGNKSEKIDELTKEVNKLSYKLTDTETDVHYLNKNHEALSTAFVIYAGMAGPTILMVMLYKCLKYLKSSS